MVNGMGENILRGLRRLAAGGLGIGALLMLLGPAGTALAQEPPVTLTPIADAYVLDGAGSNVNFGHDASLFTKTSSSQNFDSYLKFDTSGIGSVRSAKLRINATTAASGIVMAVHPVAATGWSENTITWNNKPARGAALGTATVSLGAFVYYEIDVTNYLAAEKAAGRNIVSFALHNSTSSSQQIVARSREAGSNRPQLVINPGVRVVSLLPAVSTVALGATTNLTLTISSAQPTDTPVALAASPGGIVFVADQVIVPAGQTSVPVTVATLAFGQAGVTASLNGSSASAGVNVVPAPVAVTALEPASLTM